MDSLFDASIFDAPKPDSIEKGEASAGQLDIFGNVIALEEVVAKTEQKKSATPGADAEDDNDTTDNTHNLDSAVTAAGNDALSTDAAVDAANDIDPLEAAELLGSVTAPTGVSDDDNDNDNDDDLLNDPAWEPDVDIESTLDESLVADLHTSAVEHVTRRAADDRPDQTSHLAVNHAPELVTEHLVGPDGKRLRSVDALWTSVVGQSAAVDLLRSAAQQPIHAYLFVGPAGSGRRQAARAFGASLLCPNGGCGDCNICVRAVAEIHPDLLVVEREGASISVDQAREIIRLATRSPVEGARKVLVLTDFHLVTNAGPTLLKIIEEPPPSTVFVVLAEQVTNELVTIASRCVQVVFAPVSGALVISTLIDEGVDPEAAERAARAAGGRLDRARLLANDPQLATRFSFWQTIPKRLDGTGAAVSVIASEAIGLVDGAAVGPLEAQQAAETKALEERIELTGGRGSAGLKKELVDRHKRELKRLRDDELRFGFTALQHAFHERATDASLGHGDVRFAIGAVQRIAEANEQLIRNPNVALLLQALLLDLSPTR
jgi:DNA polymerase III subunit delta'